MKLKRPLPCAAVFLRSNGVGEGIALDKGGIT